MRRLLRFILLKPVLWAVNKFSSRPDRKKIFKALSKLYAHIIRYPGKKGLVIPFEEHAGKFIIFSDQHKGRRNGADDFMMAENNYLTALGYYSSNDFCYINLGDSEELWENNIRQVKKMNKVAFEAEKKFLDHNKYVKVYGNHDLFWNTSPLSSYHLNEMYGEKIRVYEGVVLKTVIGTPQTVTCSDGIASLTPANSPLTIFLTHGHQGDGQSDGNKFSKFFVAFIWAPLQALLRINPNTPAYNTEKKTLHNSIMFEWSARKKNMLLVTGHTHQPVFASLTLIEKLYKQFQVAGKDKNAEQLTSLLNEIKKREKDFTAVAIDYMGMKPSYFNSGCCCYSDGDITGIEIEDGSIRLIKWSSLKGREILEQEELAKFVDR